MGGFGQIQRVREADAVERQVVAHLLVISVFDVQRRDVIGEQHNFVGEQLMLVLVPQVLAGQAADDVDQEVAGAGAGVENGDAFVAERQAELGLQDVFDALAHEVHNRLRGIDDAVGVRLIFAEALEEALVDGVQEPLLLGIGRDRPRFGFNSDVKVVQPLQEVLAAERLPGEGVNDFFNLAGDDVAVGKLGLAQHGAKQPLGQKVLHQHFFNRLIFDRRVQGFFAERVELLECFGKLRVTYPRPVNDRFEAASKVRDVFFELGDGFVELFNLLVGVRKKAPQQVGKLGRLLNVCVQHHLPVLIQDGPARVFKDGINQRILALDFLLDLRVQIVARVFGFPVAARDFEFILERRIGPAEAAVELLFQQYRPSARLGNGVQQLRKSKPGRLLMQCALGSDCAEVGVICLKIFGRGGDKHTQLYSKKPAASAAGMKKLPPAPNNGGARVRIILLLSQSCSPIIGGWGEFFS